MKVLITTSSFGKDISAPLDKCAAKCEIIMNPHGRKVTREEFLYLSEDVDGIIAGTETIDRELLMMRPTIKVISRCGVGMDNIDLDACKELGVLVYNTPDAPVDSVAELTLTLVLELLKNVSGMTASLKEKKWNRLSSSMLKGKNVGIVGMGRIGKRVAELIGAFGVNLAYYDIEKKNVKIEYKTLEELLTWADIVSIHSSVAQNGVALIGSPELKMMKKEAYLVNTARGRLVDEDALYDCLISGCLVGAALDVFPEEPYKGKLCELDNIILTPHIASSAKEARAVMEMEAVNHLLTGLGVLDD